jgi:hypothetical protein
MRLRPALCVLAALSACDDADVASRGSASPGTVDCSAAITSRVDARWRGKSVVRGPFGLYGDATDIRRAERRGRTFWTKVPVILAGHRPATLRVPSHDRHRIGLTYGPSRSHGLAAAPRRLRFMPCRDRATTAWPGGLALADRRGVTLQVRLDGRPWRSLRLPGRGP